MESRKLYRSRSDKMLAGVCHGLAQYLNLDTTVVRLLFVLLFFLGGHGLLIYLILWILLPVEPVLAPAPYTNPDSSGVTQ